jgi:arginyl-tRNA synthetase
VSEIPTDLSGHVEAQVRKTLREQLSAAGKDASAADTMPIPLERPRDSSHGDLALKCFPFAKALGTNPPGAASAIADALGQDSVIEAAEATGPFVNIRYAAGALAASVAAAVLDDRAPFGPWQSNGKTVVVDYSSPNIAKPFHIGHLRSTVIGAAIYRILRHTGHNAIGINHLGDWGTPQGKIIVSWQEWGDEDALRENPVRHLYDNYVKFGEEAKQDDSLNERAAEAFRRLESGQDNAERRLWNMLREVSLEAFNGPYRRLGVSFDHVTGESFYEDKVEAALQTVIQAGITTESDGALVVEMDYKGCPKNRDGNNKPALVRKSDGTTNYTTRDLAALFYRRETFSFDRALYVVGGEQKVHFLELKNVLKKLGWSNWDDVEHVPFGLVLGKDEETGKWGKLKSREGDVIFLDDVFDQAVARVRQVIEEKNPELANKDAVAEQIGVSAIVFNDLKNGRIGDVKFDWDAMLSFEGETGPYVQYAAVRLASILRKAEATELLANPAPADVDWSLLADAREVLLTMQEFGPALQRAVDRNEPSVITQLMVRIASTIHAYLREHRVLDAEPELRKARLALVAAGRKLLGSGLGLLGVASPEEM